MGLGFQTTSTERPEDARLGGDAIPLLKRSPHFEEDS
jgi:hypothetical protein